jgi:glutamate/tyrosine decarboxylase-like PLP-dependent enzyme
MSLKAHGVDAFTQLIEQNVAQARELERRLRLMPEVEVVTPVTLNIVCFRLVRPGLTGEQEDALTKELLLRIQEEGTAVPSGSQFDGRYIIRVACSNHRAKWEDFELFLRAVSRISGSLVPH